jgi:hypothetical protein
MGGCSADHVGRRSLAVLGVVITVEFSCFEADNSALRGLVQSGGAER